MGSLFGSSPSVQTINPGNSSTLDPNQANIESLLSSFLGSGASTFAPTYTGQVAAPLTTGQSSTIGSLTSAVPGTSSNLTAANSGFANAESTLGSINSSGPADFSNYFNASVVQPNEQVFNQQTLPSIEKAFAAGGAGGSGSEYGQAVNTAAENLDSTLANASASTALSQYDQNQQNKLTASSEEGSLSTLPLQSLASILSGQTQAQTTQQTADTNTYNAFENTVGQDSTYAQLLDQFLGAKTTSPNDVVVNPGQSSGLGSLLGGLGSLGTGYANLNNSGSGK